MAQSRWKAGADACTGPAPWQDRAWAATRSVLDYDKELRMKTASECFAVRSSLGVWTAVVWGALSLTTTSVSAQDPAEDPQFLELSVHIRDFGPDHPDFDVTPSDGYGYSMGNIAPRLDADGKPVFTGEGYRVSRDWRDADNDKICWTLYDAALGDKEGSQGRAD